MKFLAPAEQLCIRSPPYKLWNPTFFFNFATECTYLPDRQKERLRPKLMPKENELSIFYYLSLCVFSVVTELQILAKQPTFFHLFHRSSARNIGKPQQTKFFVVVQGIIKKGWVKNHLSIFSIDMIKTHLTTYVG